MFPLNKYLPNLRTRRCSESFYFTFYFQKYSPSGIDFCVTWCEIEVILLLLLKHYLFCCTRSWLMALWICSCGMQSQLQHMGSSSWPEIKPRRPALGAHRPSHWTVREVPEVHTCCFFPYGCAVHLVPLFEGHSSPLYCSGSLGLLWAHLWIVLFHWSVGLCAGTRGLLLKSFDSCGLGLTLQNYLGHSWPLKFHINLGIGCQFPKRNLL